MGYLSVLIAATAIAFLTTTPAVAAELPPATVPTAGSPAAEAKFDIFEFRVLGNTVLPARDIERVVYPFLGPGKSVADVQNARLALENFYHKQGYGTVFVDIPEQEVKHGLVRLKVTEGRIAQSQTTGAKYFSEREVRAAIPEAETGKVPNLQSLQTQLGTVNAVTPDRVVTPILKAGVDPGTVDLTLKVDDHVPFHGSVELNNQYTVDTSSLRGIASLSYDNLFGRHDSISAQYQFSPQNRSEVGVLVANYLTHIDWAQLAFYYLHSTSSVATLSTAGAGNSLLVLGNGKAGGARLILPLENTASTTQTFSFVVEYKDFLQSINPQGNPDPNQPSAALLTPIHYIDFSADYSAFWRDGPIQRSFDISSTLGARNLSSSALDFDNKRFEARPNFFYLRSSFSAGANLPKNFTVLWRVAGQFATAPVVSNEQYSIAGADGVRGYLEAEVLSDSGLKSTMQLGSPKLRIFSDHLNSDIFAFFDVGLANLRDALPGEATNTTLRSWGVGLNISLLEHLTGSLTWADPLANGSVTRAGDSRVLFSVRGSW